jgi:hypothetical protein
MTIWQIMILMHRDEYALRVREIMAELRRKAAAGNLPATRSLRLVRSASKRRTPGSSEAERLAVELRPPPQHDQLRLERLDERRLALAPRAARDDAGQPVGAGPPRTRASPRWAASLRAGTVTFAVWAPTFGQLWRGT